MNQRERFINYMAGKPVDRVPVMEIGPWGQTVDRWEGEGMPPEANAIDMLVGGNAYFGLDGINVLEIDLLPPYPRREEAVMEEDERFVLFIDEYGRTRKALKEGTSHGIRLSMDHYIDWPVKNMDDFKAYKKGYAKETVAARYPQNWDALAQGSKTSEKPVSLLNPMVGTFGFYSMLRDFLGTEGLSYLLYDDPALIREMLDTLLEYALEGFGKAVREAEVDFYILHEDMCFKTGPLISPDMFRTYFMGIYRTFLDFLKSNGVKNVMMDTDGNFLQLLPMYLDCGIDSIMPCECAAGMDVVQIRKEYPELAIMGGIDKRAVIKGKEAIDAELNYKIGSIIKKGRYIPTIDHSIPPDISLENFTYYLEAKRRFLE